MKLKFALFVFATIQIVAGDWPTRYEFLKFVLEWPPGFCMSNPDCLRNPDTFIIHGLWPSNFSGAIVERCTAVPYTAYRNPDDIYYLDPKWMNLKIATAPGPTRKEQWLWRHEWDTHGTCYYLGQDYYFSDAVKLYRKFDVANIFGANGITRRNFYSLRQMSSAIKRTTGFRPDIRCNNFPNTHLVEVVTCWDSQAVSPIDCTQGRTCGANNNSPNIYFA